MNLSNERNRPQLPCGKTLLDYITSREHDGDGGFPAKDGLYGMTFPQQFVEKKNRRGSSRRRVLSFLH
jgi:hypothetical protein